MACSKTLKGWVAPNGGITFNKKKSPTGIEMEVPCGQCWSCRLARSREWATRLVKESLQWDEQECSFLTLTYNNENLPADQSLKLEHFQAFMKSLRHKQSHIGEDGKRVFKKIKFFHCGEYGQSCRTCGESFPAHAESKSHLITPTSCQTFSKGLGRPHYHAIIFGVKFNDLLVFKRTKSGETIYKSQYLDDIWEKGFCSVGKVTFESCAYVSRYIMKKINGDQAKDHYIKQIIDKETGEVSFNPVKPEYITMSRNPAIGYEYCIKNQIDITKNDGVLLKRRGRAFLTKPPRYFDKQLEKEDPLLFEIIKKQRREKQRQNKKDNTDERSLVKEIVKKVQTKTLTRHFEEYHE